MEHRNEILSAFISLGEKIKEQDQEMLAFCHRASLHNKWFTLESILKALEALAENYLNSDNLKNWVSHYYSDVSAEIETDQSKIKIVAIIMAGNIPLVGFHDFLAVLISGYKVQIKLSDKDPYLIEWIIKTLNKINPIFSNKIEIATRLRDFDAVIATGSNNSSLYFHQYFSKYPHIIRKNRNGVAVLSGKENKADLKDLSKDIFSYFGLGCRNVSKLYLPEEYNFDQLVEAVNLYSDLANHNKYKNNVEYNSAIHILNKVPSISLPHIIFIEDSKIASRIGVVHFEYYTKMSDLMLEMKEKKEEIQCLVSMENLNLSDLKTFSFGKAQSPSLMDYADGVDTMQFLKELN